MIFFTGTRKPNFKNIKFFNYDEYWLHRGVKIKKIFMDREKIFMDWINEKSSVLDIACGNSPLLLELKQEKKCKVEGIDVSSVVVKEQNKIGVNAYVKDIGLDSFQLEKQYDFIVLSEILEHLAYPEKLINKIKNKSKYLLISLPNSAFYRYRLGLLLKGRFFTQWACHPSEHLRFWSHIDFIDWLEAMGLEVEDCKSSNGLTIGPIKLFNIRKNLFGHQICYLVKAKK